MTRPDLYMAVTCRMCGYRRFTIQYVPSVEKVHITCERCEYEWWEDPAGEVNPE